MKWGNGRHTETVIGFKSGFSSCLEKPFCQFEDERDITGVDYQRNLNVENEFVCQEKCNSHEFCEAFLYITEQAADQLYECWLKWNRASGQLPFVGSVISGFKSGTRDCIIPP